jgi:hypothetical protein
MYVPEHKTQLRSNLTTQIPPSSNAKQPQRNGRLKQQVKHKEVKQ